MIFPGRAPTFEEIATNAVVEGCMAAFYPQMGGYCGKCWVRSSDNGDNGEPPCFEVAVYHDGEFPFEGGNPIILHHCSAEQFSRFGELCGAFLGDPRKRS